MAQEKKVELWVAGSWVLSIMPYTTQWGYFADNINCILAIVTWLNNLAAKKFQQQHAENHKIVEIFLINLAAGDL